MDAHAQAGFTFVELMAGLLIGLLTTVVIAQVLASAEGQRRATTSGTDAQINGSLALYTLQRDLQMAGYGIGNPDAFGCTLSTTYAALSSLTLAPVVISDGGEDGSPDSLAILASDKAGASIPVRVTEHHEQDATTFVVASTLNIAAGDHLAAVPATWDAANGCALFAATATSSSAASGTTVYNVEHASISSISPSAGYPAKSYLVNLGSFGYRRYSVGDSHTMQLATISMATGEETVADAYPEIVNLQALYGTDSDGDGVVDTYTSTTPTTATDWQRVLNIRVALLARSAQYEKDAVTAAAPTWNVRLSASDSADTPLPLRVDQLTDWQHYRYKIFDTVVPLRNVLWNS